MMTGCEIPPVFTGKKVDECHITNGNQRPNLDKVRNTTRNAHHS